MYLVWDIGKIQSNLNIKVLCKFCSILLISTAVQFCLKKIYNILVMNYGFYWYQGYWISIIFAEYFPLKWNY